MFLEVVWESRQHGGEKRQRGPGRLFRFSRWESRAPGTDAVV